MAKKDQQEQPLAVSDERGEQESKGAKEQESKGASEQARAFEPDRAETPQTPKAESFVSYEALTRAEVKVRDQHGNLYYLAPGNRQGDFVLRVIPK